MRAKKLGFLLAMVAAVWMMVSCENNLGDPSLSGGPASVRSVKVTGQIQVAAAASLKNAFEGSIAGKPGIIPTFQTQSGITVTGTYGSSGDLANAIIAGTLYADVFMSAAEDQMNKLVPTYVNQSAIVPLLTNSLVLIKKTGTTTSVTSFDTVLNVKTPASIALGDPDTVPAGKYAMQLFSNLPNPNPPPATIWDAILAGHLESYRADVTLVLNAVLTDTSIEVGVVYGTDAASVPGQVDVLDTEAISDIIYPVAPLILAQQPEADDFVTFLQTPTAIAIFQSYGFSPYTSVKVTEE